MSETQATITAWQNETFGPTTVWAAFVRARREWFELTEAVHDYEAGQCDLGGLAVEIADVFITLYRVADKLGIELHEVIDAKMALNRSRKWAVDSTGNGQHVG